MDPDALRSWLERSTYSDAGCLYNSVTLRPIRAVVPMHTFGHPCDLNGILAVAREFDLIVVEDAAEALGSRYLDKHTGHYGLVGAFSFNGNKIVTTGGGGALVTDDPVLADRARHLATTARVPHEWAISHDEVGYNFRMPALNAALGCGQIERLPEMLKSKRRLYAAYQAAFEELDGVTVFGEPVNCRSNYWLQTVVLDPERAEDLQDVLRLTNEAGYQVRPAWTLLSEMAQFAKCPRAGLPVSESLAGRLLNLPSSAGLA
jgi:dTDP-4-amino-4,6-dideoxygalactose transaminase